FARPEPDRPEKKRARASEPPLDGWEMLAKLSKEGKLGSRTSWRPEPWEPKSDDDRVVDRFFRDRDVAVLGGSPLKEDEVLPESGSDARAADPVLREKLRLVTVWRGEPDAEGGQKAVEGRYTIVCKGVAQTPVVRTKNARGQTAPTREAVNNPELVVDVRG